MAAAQRAGSRERARVRGVAAGATARRAQRLARGLGAREAAADCQTCAWD